MAFRYFIYYLFPVDIHQGLSICLTWIEIIHNLNSFNNKAFKDVNYQKDHN